MIVSVLEKAGYAVEFHDYQTYPARRKPDPATFGEFLAAVESPVIGISTLSGNLPTVLLAVRRLKRDRPEKKIIVGGPAATDSPEGIVENFPVDIVVRGEGEVTVVELARCLEEGSGLEGVRGITYRVDGEIRSTPNRNRIRDLDSLPFPAYHKIDFGDYGSGVHLMTSRGCPYGCEFCSTHSIWQRQVTYRSITSILDEILSIRDRVNMLTFCDDNPALQQSRMLELCRRLKGAAIGFPWSSYGRVNHMGESMIEEMVAAGCVEVFYGIESGSNAILRKLKKKLTIEEAQACLKMTRRHVQQVNASFIWGFPYEGINDFYDTLMAIGEAERNDIKAYLYLLGPFRQTPLFRSHGHLIRFSEAFYPHVSTIPIRERLSDYPEVIELVKNHPDMFAGFCHYDHPELVTKKLTLEKLGLRRAVSADSQASTTCDSSDGVNWPDEDV
jgi:radical SAM superfamily enzyme YgiQ (UPF0313 family)